MLTEEELRSTALERLEEAEALFSAGKYSGAHYLSGYAVEIALKVVICRCDWWRDFPASEVELKNSIGKRKEILTHDLDSLLGLCGQATNVKANHFSDWSTVQIWNPESRYKPANATSEQEARNMIDSTRNILKTLGVL